MVARCLMCPVVMEFQYERAWGAQVWRYYLQLGFDVTGETKVSLGCRHLRPRGYVGRYWKSQWSGWRGSWKKLGTDVFVAKFHYSGNEKQAYEHRIYKISVEHFAMDTSIVVFIGLKTKVISEKQLTDGVTDGIPIAILEPIEVQGGDMNQPQMIFYFKLARTSRR